MKRIRLYIAAICVTAYLGSPSFAAIDLADSIEESAEKTLSAPATKAQWKALWKSAEEAFSAERYQDSLKLYKLAMAQFTDLSEPDEKTIDEESTPFLIAMADTFRKLAYYEKSTEVYSNILKELTDKESNYLIPVLNGSADISLIEGRFDAAESYLNRAVDVSIKQKIESTDSLQSKIFLAQVKLARSKLQDSENLYVEVVSLASHLGDKGDALKADGWQGLAELELFRMNSKKAEEYAQKALTLRKKIFSDDSLECASSLKSLADATKTSNPAESQQLAMKALAIQIKKLGTQNHPIVGSTMLSLIDFDANLPQAEQLSLAASHTADGSLTKDAPFNSECLSKQSFACFRALKLKLALDSCQNLLDHRTRLYGPQSLQVARTLNYLATVQIQDVVLRHHFKPIKLAKEESLIQQAMTIAKNCSGEVSYDYGSFLYSMAWASYFAGDVAAIEDYARKSIKTFDQITASTGNDVTLSYYAKTLLLHALIKQEQLQEARELAGLLLDHQIKKNGLYDESVFSLFKKLGDIESKTPDLPPKSSSRIGIVGASAIANEILMNTGFYEMSPERLDGFLAEYEAGKSSDQRRLQLLLFALNGAERKYGSDSPKIAGYLVSLGDYYTKVYKFSEAETNIKRAISIIENGLGEEHPLMIHALSAYSQLFDFLGKEAEAAQQLARRDKIKASLEQQYKKLSN